MNAAEPDAGDVEALVCCRIALDCLDRHSPAEIAPLAQHRCTLPSEQGGYGSTGKPDGTLIRCGECLRWWESRPCYESFGPVDWWRPVRWWNLTARRRIAREEASRG